jgi:hypothetical protein
MYVPWRTDINCCSRNHRFNWSSSPLCFWLSPTKVILYKPHSCDCAAPNDKNNLYCFLLISIPALHHMTVSTKTWRQRSSFSWNSSKLISIPACPVTVSTSPRLDGKDHHSVGIPPTSAVRVAQRGIDAIKGFNSQLDLTWSWVPGTLICQPVLG